MLPLNTRIAPTPSGFLHLGNAWSFTLAWLAARATKGTVRLRIDDLDAARVQDEYLDDIFKSLRWLGLDWDYGPIDVEDFQLSHSQVLRRERYRMAVEALKVQGRAYACTCTRAQIRENGLIYTGTCRSLARAFDATDTAVRFSLDGKPAQGRDVDGGAFAFHPARDLGDFVLIRRDGEPAYQLASVLDDEAHLINFVVRGLDLMPSTGGQLALAAALGLDGFGEARFWHHPLVVDDTGEKLSKSQGAESLAALRTQFPDATPVLRWFAQALGMSDRNVRSVNDLLPGFDPSRVSRSPLYLSEFWSFVDQEASGASRETIAAASAFGNPMAS